MMYTLGCSTMLVDTDHKHQIEQREQRAQRLLQLVEQEAAQGAERRAVITAGWAALQKEQPEGVENVGVFAKQVAVQRAACDAALQGQRAAVEARVAEVRARDEAYVRAVEQQGRDVDALLAKMRADSAAMQARYEVSA